MNKIIIPDNTVLIKICSLNIGIADDINRSDDINIITSYIFNKINNVEADIICLQGINNLELARHLTKSIQNYSTKHKIAIEIIPNLGTDSRNSSHFSRLSEIKKNNNIEESKKNNNIGESKKNNNIEESKKNNNIEELIKDDIIFFDKLIISRYPIISNYYDFIINDKKSSKNTILMANINVHKYIFSIYNVSLSYDYTGISNSHIRSEEVDFIKKSIKSNSKKIVKDNLNSNYDPLIFKDIHIICGKFYVPEFKYKNFNQELALITRKLKAIDIHRFVNKDYSDKSSKGESSLKVENKTDYIMFLLLKYKNDIDIDKLDKLINKNYDINFVMSYIVQNVNINANSPLETILLLNLQNRKSLSETIN